MKNVLLLLMVIAAAAAAVAVFSPKTHQNRSKDSGEKIRPAAISPEEANKRLKSGEEIILLDVRTQGEYEERHIPESVLIPLDELKKRAEAELPDKDKVVFVYCRSGNRSTTASSILAELGYKKVYNMGGISDWPYEVKSGI